MSRTDVQSFARDTHSVDDTAMNADPSRRALELYEILLEENPEARTAHLDQECAADPELRRRVESLLAAAPPSTPLDVPTGELNQAALETGTFMGEAGWYIGDFRIEKRLGAGGMGQVFLATDARLRRTVAIKVVSERLGGGDSWRKRLLTEAQAISALNHPNICTLHDIGQHEGVDYLVMEYLDGETLADRLRRKALSLEETIRIADQVASALHSAHSRGILHRDLKPGNIMLTDQGAKVLDFGLAKFTASNEPGHLPTSTHRASSGTTPGIILGTVSYMSPEQARGDTLDQQSDIWSFGCVLYEMLSRRQAFGGKTQSDCIAACLEREPDWSALPRSTPSALRLLLDRCLSKDREFRLHDMADARIELRAALSDRTMDSAKADKNTVSASISRKRVAVLLVITFFSAVAVTAFGFWSLFSPRPPTAAGPRRALSITLPDTAPLVLERSLPFSIGRPLIALSPDGGRLIYVARHGESSLLYQRALIDDARSRSLDDFGVKPIAGTEGAFDPFFSPDGEWVAFFAAQRLHKVSLRGGRPVPLCDAPEPFGGTWGPENKIVFASAFGSQLHIVSANGESGDEVALRRGLLLGGGASNFHWPQFLPGGRSVIISTGYLDNRLEVISIPDGRVLARIEEPGNRPLYMQSGHLVFGRSGDLYALPFDPERLEVTGSAVPVIAGVRTTAHASGGAHQSAVANDGTMAFVSGPALDVGTLVWADEDGNESPAFGGLRDVFGAFQISPDGERLAVTVLNLSLQVWIYDLTGSRRPIRITSEGQNLSPVWHEDEGGTRVVFTSLRDDRLDLLSKLADGSGEAEKLLPEDWKGGLLNKPRAVSPDGKVLLFDATHHETGTDIWTYRFDAKQAEPFLQTPDEEGGPALSPDGKSLAYFSNRSGDSEIYVCSFPKGGIGRRISTNGGEEPIWAPDGNAVFYRIRDRWMKAAPDGSSDEPLFSGPYLNVPGISYGYDPNRGRFLLIRGIAAESAPDEIRIILNAFDKLDRLAPSRKP